MSVLHIALFKWSHETTAAQVSALAEALDALKVTMPTLISYEHGPDLGVREGTFDYGVIAEFDNADQVTDYLDHPRHQSLFDTFLAPILAGRSAVQIRSGRPSERP